MTNRATVATTGESSTLDNTDSDFAAVSNAPVTFAITSVLDVGNDQGRRARVRWNADPHDAAGRGTVHSFTVVHHVTHPAVSGRTPYVVALVELAEGPRVICNVLEADPDDVVVGGPVVIALGLSPAGAELPQARLAGAEPDGGS